MSWIPCEHWHLTEVKPQPMQAGVTTPEDWTSGKNLEAVRILRENCRTLMNGDRPIACAGVRPMWHGVGEAWTLLSEEALLHPRDLTVAIERMLSEIEERDDYWRIQSFVDCQHEAGIRWIEFLGFVREGTLSKFSPLGRDMHLYARVV